MKYVTFPTWRGDEYLFLNAPLRNFHRAICSQAIYELLDLVAVALLISEKFFAGVLVSNRK